jgi:SAM-dependent methyltransferase
VPFSKNPGKQIQSIKLNLLYAAKPYAYGQAVHCSCVRGTQACHFYSKDSWAKHYLSMRYHVYGCRDSCSQKTAWTAVLYYLVVKIVFTMNNFWDERYSSKEYVYGEAPNEFLATALHGLAPGVIILPCEGEGRNAVYAARQGWAVHAFDSSTVGREKAMDLAAKHYVQIDYTLIDAADAEYPENSADVVAFIFTHFPHGLREKLCAKAAAWLKPGGHIIFQVFSTEQLGRPSGGPKDVNLLYTLESVRNCFAMDIELLEQREVNLDEGAYHHGAAIVINCIAVKVHK